MIECARALKLGEVVSIDGEDVVVVERAGRHLQATPAVVRGAVDAINRDAGVRAYEAGAG